MKRKIFLAALIIIASLSLFGCASKERADGPDNRPEPAKAQLQGDTFEIVRQEADKYLKRNKALYITPAEVHEKYVVQGDQSYYLVDVRGDEHYASAHIPGAVHINYADAWREDKIEYLPRDKKVVVVCYSGHSASQVAVLWNMLGIDAVPMQYGMSGWSRDKAVIGASPLACGPLNYAVVPGATEPQSFGFPSFEAKVATAAELLSKRAEAATPKPAVIQPADLKARLASGSYYIVDIRGPEHYQAGHIEGAVNVPFRSLAESDSLKRISPDKEIVVAGYDGHSASQAARILNMLGYSATALKDGMSVWTGDEKITGTKTIACNIAENGTVKLNAFLQAGPSTAAT